MLDFLKAGRLKKNLNSPRTSARAIIAMLIFGAIVVVFVFFGMPSRNEGQGMGAVATVNNTLISAVDLTNETKRLEQMYGQMFGGQFGGDAQRQFLRQQALENLITGEIISSAAQKEGVLSTDAEIRDFITKEVPVFQKDGKFDRSAYLGYLQYINSTAGEFEEKIRKDRKTQRARRLLELAATPTELEIKKAKALKEQKVNVAFVKIDKENFAKRFKPSEADLKAYMSSAEFDKKAQDFYNNNKAQFTTEAEVRAQHILVKSEAGNEASEKAALAKVQEIKAKAKTEDFGALAAKFSDDPGSKAKKGDLGFFGKGRMVPEFETAAFNQAVGVVGEPVKTPYGYHIIKVLEKREAKTTDLAQAKPRIASELLAAEKFDSYIKSLEEALAKQDKTAVDNLVQTAGLNWEETGYFDLSVDAVPKLQGTAANQAAFELNAKYTLLNHLVRDGNNKYVMKLKDSKTEVQPESKEFASTLAKQKSENLFSEWIEKNRKSARIERNQQLLQNR